MSTIATVLVAYNILLCIFNIVKLQSLKIPSTSRVRAFVFALLGYPIAQVISRVPIIVYNYIYGYIFYYNSQSPTDGQTAALYISYITNPAAGIGFLIVFLYTQAGSFDVCMDFLYSMVGSTWRVTAPKGTGPSLFHQDTAFFSTSIRRVNSINIVPSGPSIRHNVELSPADTVIPNNGTNMNDDFGEISAPDATTSHHADAVEAGKAVAINSPVYKAIDNASENDAEALYTDLFDKFQEEET